MMYDCEQKLGKKESKKDAFIYGLKHPFDMVRSEEHPYIEIAGSAVSYCAMIAGAAGGMLITGYALIGKCYVDEYNKGNIMVYDADRELWLGKDNYFAPVF